MQSTATQTPQRFDDRPVGIIGLPVPGIKNTASNDVIRLAIYRYGLAPLIDERRCLVRVYYSVDDLDNWEAERVHERPLSIATTANIGEARVVLAQSRQALLPILKGSRYSGYCASLGQLGDLDEGILRPTRVGGLATPLGVYMTTGVHTGGAGLMGMLLMGVVFGTAAVLIDWLFPVFLSALVALVPHAYALTYGMSADMLHIAFIMVFTLALLQFTPLSALHAAEHMTIHALENDLPIDDATVSRQPRAHPRCGTNLAVIMVGLQIAALFFMELSGKIAWYGLLTYAVFWVALLYHYWHRAGMWVQWHFTTRQPNTAQLASGIKAGNDVISRFAADPHPMPSIVRRLWTMGFLQLMGGFIVAATVAQTLIILALNQGRLPGSWWQVLF